MAIFLEKQKIDTLKLIASGLFFVITLLSVARFATNILPGYDFSQYWAASKLFISGENPYKPDSLYKLQENLFPESNLINPQDGPIIMYNPPVILPLIFWFGFFDFQNALAIFYFISLITILLTFSAFSFSSFSSKLIFTFLILVFTFLREQLYWGQISIMILLAFLGYYFLRTKYPIWSGFCLAITLIKPHHLYLIYLLEFFLALKCRNFKLVLGFLGAATMLTVLPLFYDLEIWSKYLNLMANSPASEIWITSSLVSNLNAIYAIGNLAKILIFSPGLFLGTYLILKSKFDYEKLLPVLLILSIMCSPYFWGYDLVILFVAFGIAIRDHLLKTIDLVTLAGLALATNFAERYQDLFYVVPVIFMIFFLRSYGLLFKRNGNQIV